MLPLLATLNSAFRFEFSEEVSGRPSEVSCPCH